MVGLLELPNEMLLFIVEADQLSTTDLKSIRLTDRLLSSIAHTPLFRNLSVRIKPAPRLPTDPPLSSHKSPPINWLCTVGAREFPISWASDPSQKRVVSFTPSCSGRVKLGANPFGDERQTQQPPWHAVRYLTLVARVPEHVPFRSLVEKVTDAQLAVLNFACNRMKSLEVLKWTARCIHLSTSYALPPAFFSSLRESHITLRAWRELPAGHVCKLDHPNKPSTFLEDCVGPHLSRNAFYANTIQNITHLTIKEAFYIGFSARVDAVCWDIANWVSRSPNLTSLTLSTNRREDDPELPSLSIDQGLTLLAICERWPGDGPLPIRNLTVPILTLATHRGVHNYHSADALGRLSNLKTLTILKPSMVYRDIPNEETASRHGILLEELTLPRVNKSWLSYLRSPQLPGVLRKLDVHLPYSTCLDRFWSTALPQLGEGGSLEELHLRSCISTSTGYTPRGTPSQTKALRSCNNLKILTITPGNNGKVWVSQLLEMCWSVRECFLPELETLNLGVCCVVNKQGAVCGQCKQCVGQVEEGVREYGPKRKSGGIRRDVKVYTVDGREVCWRWREIRGRTWRFVKGNGK